MSSLKELLLQTDTQSDAERIVKRLTDESSIFNVDLTLHLKSWAKNKQHLFELFGNKLRVEQEVTSYVSDEMVSDKIDRFLSRDLDGTQYFLIQNFLRAKLSNKEIGQNYLDQDVTFFKTRFNKGMKISRILPRLCDSRYSEHVQKAYSRVVESFTFTGKAVLSIDPVDYITMSEGSNWRSCHALDGEFRTGIFGYMMDSASVVAYVTNKDIDVGQGVVYPDKMWRQIVWFSNPLISEIDFAIQSRQYPSKNKSNNKTIESMIIKLLEDKHGHPNKPLKLTQADLLDMMKEPNVYTDMWYNDIRRGSISKANVIMPEYFIDKFESNTGAFYKKVCIGVRDIYCGCGCGLELNDPGVLFCSSIDDYEDDEYDNEEE